MRTCDLKEVTGKELKKWWEWLVREQAGCCSVHFASTEKYRYCVCMGWHDLGDRPQSEGYSHWVVAWKIGRQTHNNIMQCDLDVDFEMPYVTAKMANENKGMHEGDVDDTLEVVDCHKIIDGPGKWHWSKPDGYRSWDMLAAKVWKTARRVFKDWKYCDE